jgi:hypothetical protein
MDRMGLRMGEPRKDKRSRKRDEKQKSRKKQMIHWFVVRTIAWDEGPVWLLAGE